MTRVRIAVIGAGWWSSQVHAPALTDHPEVELVAVADPDPDRRRAFARTFQIPASFGDHQNLLDRIRPDGAVVATPHATHATLATDCLAAGSGVLVEKPFTLDPADARRLVDYADRTGLPLVVGHPYPFHPHVSLVRTVLQQGRLGSLVTITGSFHSSAAHLYAGHPEQHPRRSAVTPRADTYADPSLSGGGQGQTQLSHLLSVLFAELNDEVVEVQARMTWVLPGVDNAVAVLLRLSTGGVVALSSTGTVPERSGHTAELRYDGTLGWLRHDALRGTLTASGGVLDDLDLATDTPAYPADAPVKMLVKLLRDGTGAANPADGVLGARVVETIAACYRSATTNPISTSQEGDL